MSRNTDKVTRRQGDKVATEEVTLSPCHRVALSSVSARRGLSLIEVMISLAICSSLLVAVAAAFSASSSAIDINDRFFRASQAGRIAMGQMLAAVRRCQDSEVGDSYDGHSASISADKLQYQAVNGKFYHYAYDATAQTLTFTDEAAGQTYTLAHNVQRLGTASIFTADMEQDPATKVMHPVRITVGFAVKIGNDTVPLSGSAVPRRSVVY